MSKICYLLIGVPASGKSTYIKKLKEASSHNSDFSKAWVASTDNIIEEIASKYGYTYDQVFSDVIKFAEKVFWDDISLAAEEGDNIIIDRTNLNKKTRKKFFDALKPHNYIFKAVVFDTPDHAEWMQRLANRPGKTIPEHVLESMKNTFEYPEMDEGFASIERAYPVVQTA